MENSKWLKEKDKLYTFLIKENKSYESVGKIYGCSGTLIRRIAQQLKLPIKARRKINPNETFRKGTGKKGKCLNCGKEFLLYVQPKKKFCSLECSSEYRSKQVYEKIKNGDSSVMKANYQPKTAKRFIMEEQNNKCAICGCLPEWNGKELVFILDHIDGRASNNKRDNLRCICPNCDSQLDTYKSKNKNSDRVYYHNHHR